MKKLNLFQLMLIVLAAMTFAACEKDKPTIMAYGMEHEVINVRDLTLWLESKYVYIKPWYSPDKEVQCFAGSDEKTGKRYLFYEGEIEGFKYEENHPYRILVREYQIANPPADASDRIYKFIKELEIPPLWFKDGDSHQ
ncbi:MAG: DUF4377 domain-containing protein [Phocaeicola sp.]|nr:DUF4377 domain-containing protein [Phocaeicola sp.]